MNVRKTRFNKTRLPFALALASCGALGIAGLLATAPLSAQDDDNMAYVGANLFGEYEVGHKGAGEDADGNFSAEIDLDKGRMCYMLEVEGLDEVTAAHIHEGEKGANGDVVVTLQLNDPDGDDICVTLDKDLLAKIASRKGKYYVNVHSKQFPDGALRGQLNH